MLRDGGQKQLEILVGVQVVRLGCLDDAVDDSAGFGTFIRLDQDEVLPPDRKRPDGLLGQLF